MVSPHARYQKPEHLRKAILDFFADPPMRKVHYRDGTFEVPNITSQSLAIHLGFSGRRSLYMQAVRGEEWEEIIELYKSLVKDHYEHQGQHGNGPFSTYMLSCLGEKSVTGIDHTSSDGSMRPKDVDSDVVSALVDKLTD